MPSDRLVYVSFDRFPSPKGAATHIQAFASALGREYGGIDLVTVDPRPAAEMPGPGFSLQGRDHGDGITHYSLPVTGENLVERVLAFRRALSHWWQDRRAPVVHVRSIYEGYPIALRKDDLCDGFVVEINGLPSIELKYHYPNVADDEELTAKLIAQEQVCLDAADCIITPSDVTARHLQTRGVERERIRVIPNGVDLRIFTYQAPRPWQDRCVRMLYAGTMSAWQGVHQAIEALALYRRDFPARLTLVGPARIRQQKQIAERCAALDVTEHVELLEPVSKEELAAIHHACDVVLAPLLPNDRNLTQGCCPLKVLEAMASGTPVIASRMPVVEMLSTDSIHALHARAGSAKAIKDCMLRLLQEDGLGVSLSQAAREQIEANFTWEQAQESLIQAYEDYFALSRSNTRAKADASAPG